MRRKALGKGLEALIPELKIDTVKEERLIQVPVSMIKPNRYQPRKKLDRAKLKGLAESIKEKGIIQPIIVKKRGDGYELIAGERRWKALQMLGIEKVPALIKEVSGPEVLELALIENIQREELNPIEEALAYNELIKGFGMTQEELSRRVGKNRSSITNYIRLLRLPETIKQDIENNRLSMGHARALLALKLAKKQRTVRDVVVRKALSVRETENLVRKAQQELRPKKKAKKDIFLLSIEEELRGRLNTRVNISPSKKGGKIEIYYYSEEELQGLLEEIKKRGD